MGNTNSVLTEEQLKELFSNTVFDFKKSFYDAYKDPYLLQKWKESYEKQILETNMKYDNNVKN
jgi:hypothetical protein